MEFTTPDLCDAFPDAVHAAAPILRDFGGVRRFAGPIATLRVKDDNARVRSLLEAPGNGRVLVVDGGGSTRCALLGGNLAALARDNGWAGVIVHGCIRDSAEVGGTAVGVRALATAPMKSGKRGSGEESVPVAFAGIEWIPGQFVYADEDGLIVAAHDLAAAHGGRP
ncbi:MAG: ribonuclease E activity regulator RraA [Gemmatimonadales bacterium]|nr:ribonuclease E activity regulator RraA [Gemmatimonadales bacterium]